MESQPVEAAGVLVHGIATNVVYEGTEGGDLYALRARDGAVVWHQNLGTATVNCGGPQTYGIGGAGTISFSSPGAGVIYIAGGDGAVHALDLATGAEQSGWPVKGVFKPSHEHVFGGLNLFDGHLYVEVSSYCDGPPYHGGIVEIDVASHAILHHFYPAGPPSGGISGGGIWGPGGVSIDPSSADVFTATGNALTHPETYRYSDAVVKLTLSLGVLSWGRPPVVLQDDDDFGATPILFKPAGCPRTLVAAKRKDGTLVVYPERNVRSGAGHRLQIASDQNDQFNGIPAWDPATNMLYIGNSSDSSAGTFKHGMVALKAGSDCRLSLAWQKQVGPNDTSVSPPTVANGVVYYGDGYGDAEVAFDAATGKQLWSSGNTIGAQVYAAPTIINGRLFVPSAGNTIYAFGP